MRTELSLNYDSRQSFYGKAKEFLKQNHFTAGSKTQIINDYVRNDI